MSTIARVGAWLLFMGVMFWLAALALIAGFVLALWYTAEVH